MSNYYIKYQNNSSNLAIINALEMTGLGSCDESSYITTLTQFFLDVSSISKEKVRCREIELGVMQNIYIPTSSLEK